MNKLPSHLLNQILSKLQPTSLAKLRCVDKSLQSHISDDQSFQSDYFSRLGSTLLNISSFGSIKLHPLISSISAESPLSSFNPVPIHYYIVGSSSGLLLVYLSGLFVVNPLTKKFKFIDDSSAKLLPKLLDPIDIPLTCITTIKKTRIGFAVDQIDQNKQRFKIVCLYNQLSPNRIDTIYQFEIYSEDSWRISQTKLICTASELYESTNPVYVNGCLHWLRIDGSIISFNPESEEARLIPVEFPVKSKLVLCASENRINLVSAAKEKICIYVLEMEKENIRWNIEKEIENVKFEEGNLLDCSVESFDGRFVVVKEGEVIIGIENEWKVLGSIPKLGNKKSRDFYMFKPNWDCVVGLDKFLKMNAEVGEIDGSRVSTLRKIIRIIRYRW